MWCRVAVGSGAAAGGGDGADVEGAEVEGVGGEVEGAGGEVEEVEAAEAEVEAAVAGRGEVAADANGSGRTNSCTYAIHTRMQVCNHRGEGGKAR